MRSSSPPSQKAQAFYFPGIGAGMKAPFAAKFEFEVLDRVGDIAERTVDFGLVQAFIKQPASRPNEGPAGQILAVAGLFADKNHSRILRTFPENDLRGVAIKITAPAIFRIMMQFSQRRSLCVVGAEDRRQFWCAKSGHLTSYPLWCGLSWLRPRNWCRSSSWIGSPALRSCPRAAGPLQIPCRYARKDGRGATGRLSAHAAMAISDIGRRCAEPVTPVSAQASAGPRVHAHVAISGFEMRPSGQCWLCCSGAG
jgi:hypothetical protein